MIQKLFKKKKLKKRKDFEEKNNQFNKEEVNNDFIKNIEEDSKMSSLKNFSEETKQLSEKYETIISKYKRKISELNVTISILNEKNSKSNNEISVLNNRIYVLKAKIIKLDEIISQQKETIKKISQEKKVLEDRYGKTIELGAYKTQKIKILQQKLKQIQIRDLLKGIVNHNLALLKLERKGTYNKRIEILIQKLSIFKNSNIYIEFFKKIKDLIKIGNNLAHDFDLKSVIGKKNERIFDIVLDNIKYYFKPKVINVIKDIFEKIQIEKTLEAISKTFEDKRSIYSFINECDFDSIFNECNKNK